MRIFIDLHDCRYPNHDSDATIARAQALLDDPAYLADGHELWIAFSAEFPRQRALLQARFAGGVPPERVVAYALPVPGRAARNARVRELVRDYFFQTRGADAVVSPDADNATALSWQAFAHLTGRPPRRHPGLAKARLAWVAPHASADRDTAGLVDELRRFYDIDVIVPGMDTGASPHLHSGAWFDAHRAAFSRVLYHVADGPAAGPVLALLAQHPGIVVLHDFSLGNAVDSMAPGAGFLQALYNAHGYSGVSVCQRHGHAAARAAFPLNRAVFDQACGVIATDASMPALARTWYGPQSASDWHVTAAHPAESVASLALRYVDAIEDIVQRDAATRYRQLLRDLASTGIPSDPRDRTLIAIAKAIAANQPANAPRQLLVDISALVQDDLKTGIQRVVRSVLLALIKDPPTGFRVEPVYGNGLSRRYRYARRYTLDLIGQGGLAAADDPIEQQAGDIFFGLDLSAQSTVNNLDMLEDMRTMGIAVYFVVYDVLPLLQPHAFPYGATQWFGEYMRAIASHADGLVCISRAVADELSDWIGAHCAPRSVPLKIGHFHLGADLDASAPSTGMPDDAAHILASMAARPSILMVGTLEPRKAHAQALAAFDLLWARGVDVNLVIVGKEGWLVDPVVAALRTHPLLGKKLFWLPGVSDQMLTEVYPLAAALLAASVGEGFGLPLIEAAQHGLPIIARGLPVFREVSGEHAYYFDGTEPGQLADALAAWLDLFHQGLAPTSAAMPWLNWADSARQLLDAIVHDRWYRTLPG